MFWKFMPQMPANNVGTSRIVAQRGQALHHLVHPVGRLGHPQFLQRGQQVPDVVEQLVDPDHVVDHVAVVGSELGASELRAVEQELDPFAQRRDEPAQPHRLALQMEQPLTDLRALPLPVLLGEDVVLEVVHHLLETLDRAEVAVHHLVEQHVQREPGTLRQQGRLALPSEHRFLHVESWARTGASPGTRHRRRHASRSRSGRPSGCDRRRRPRRPAGPRTRSR